MLEIAKPAPIPLHSAHIHGRSDARYPRQIPSDSVAGYTRIPHAENSLVSLPLNGLGGGGSARVHRGIVTRPPYPFTSSRNSRTEIAAVGPC